MFDKYPDFWSVILGNGSRGFFFGYLVMGLVAASAMACILVVGRDKQSSNTPVEWSWKFFWANNIFQILATILLMYLFVRVAYEYIPPGWMLFICIGLGFGFYKLSHIAKRFGILTTNNLSERIKQAIEAQKNLEPNKK